MMNGWLRYIWEIPAFGYENAQERPDGSRTLKNDSIRRRQGPLGETYPRGAERSGAQDCRSTLGQEESSSGCLYDNFLRKASKTRGKEIAQEQIAHHFTSKSSCAESVYVCSEIELPGGDSLRAALLQACRSFPRRLDISPWTH